MVLRRHCSLWFAPLFVGDIAQGYQCNHNDAQSDCEYTESMELCHQQTKEQP